MADGDVEVEVADEPYDVDEGVAVEPFDPDFADE